MPEELLVLPGLLLLGFAVGSYGTVVGTGGGFLLAPLLIILYPDLAPETITSISLAVVTANALSGSTAYARQKRIDYWAAALFAVATIPGAVVGALFTERIPHHPFELSFGLLLMALATWMLLPQPSLIRTAPPLSRSSRRSITDIHEHTYRYSFDPVLAVPICLAIGLISSLFGIGGGVVLVPVLILLLRFPAHIATATSTLVLLFTAATGVAIHVLLGDYQDVLNIVLFVAIGVVAGAQVGARLSMRLETRQKYLTLLLAFAIGLVALRLIIGALLAVL